MSLINDALKRAKQVQQKPSPQPISAPLRPAETARFVHAPRPLVLPILAATLLVFVGGILIVVALSRGFRGKPAEPVANQSIVGSPKDNPRNAVALPRTANATPTISSSTAPTALQQVPTNPPRTAVAVSPIATQAVVPVESSNTVPVVPTPPEPQLPKLQGILFNPSRPTAFLNGKSVVAGGRVGEYTVLTITKQAVTVERAGQTNVLTMEE